MPADIVCGKALRQRVGLSDRDYPSRGLRRLASRSVRSRVSTGDLPALTKRCARSRQKAIRRRLAAIRLPIVGIDSGTALRTPRHALHRAVAAIEAEMAKIVEPTSGEPAMAEDDPAVEHEPVALKTHAIPAELPNC